MAKCGDGGRYIKCTCAQPFAVYCLQCPFRCTVRTETFSFSSDVCGRARGAPHAAVLAGQQRAGAGYVSSPDKPVSFPKERLAASLVVGTVRRLSAPQLTLPWPKRHAADSPIEYGPRTIALDARAHHDRSHHVNVAACATTTFALCPLHLKNRP